MKEDSMFIIGFVLILFLTGNVLATDEDKKDFNNKDVKTWEQATSDELSTIILEDLFNNYNDGEGVKIIEKMWKDFNGKVKDEFVKKYLKKLGYDVDVEDLGDEKLELNGGVLSDEAGAKFNFKNPPAGLVGISYDSKKGFTYDFGEGNVAELQKGMIETDEEGNKIITKTGDEVNLEGFKWNGKGNLKLSEGYYWLTEGAEISKEGINYRESVSGVKYPALVKPISETRATLINAEGISSGGIIKDNLLADNDGKPVTTLAVFDDLPIDSSEKRFARVGTDSIEVFGEKISVEMLKDFENAKLRGNSLELKSGSVILEVNKEGNLNLPRIIGDSPSDSFRIGLLDGPNGNKYKNKKEDNTGLFEEIKGYVRWGNSYMSLGNTEGLDKLTLHERLERENVARLAKKNGLKATLNLPETVKLEPNLEKALEGLKGKTKTLSIISVRDEIPLEKFTQSFEESARQKIEDAVTGSISSAVVETAVGRLFGGDERPLRTFVGEFVRGTKQELAPEGLESAARDAMDFQKIQTAIKEKGKLVKGDTMQFSVTVESKGFFRINNNEIEVSRRVAEEIIMGTVESYPRLLKSEDESRYD